MGVGWARWKGLETSLEGGKGLVVREIGRRERGWVGTVKTLTLSWG